jgi:hypothetical protein
MMGRVITSETAVNFNKATLCYIFKAVVFEIMAFYTVSSMEPFNKKIKILKADGSCSYNWTLQG